MSEDSFADKMKKKAVEKLVVPMIAEANFTDLQKNVIAGIREKEKQINLQPGEYITGILYYEGTENIFFVFVIMDSKDTITKVLNKMPIKDAVLNLVNIFVNA